MLRILLLLIALWPIGLGAQSQPTLPTQPSGTRVELVFDQGSVVLELYADRAPRTVERFLSLVREGFYDDTLMHRLVADMLIQGGGYGADGRPKPAKGRLVNEASNGLSNLRGTIAMARKASDADSASAQFFINLVDNPAFDYRDANAAHRMGFTVFGRVFSGMEVVDALRKTPTGANGPFRSGFPKQAIVLRKARVIDN